jgi:hypothetical protein
MPHQIDGATFLAKRSFAILADAPRVGKTGAAIMAADMCLAETILVVTTASGRGVWRKGFADWSALGRKVQILTPKDTLAPDADVAIVGWPTIAVAATRTQLLSRRWGLLILDETHYAKNFDAKRTQAVFGTFGEKDDLLTRYALAGTAERVWCLTGTPMPNSPNDLYPMLRGGSPERLVADPARGWPNVSSPDAFLNRYCTTRPKKLSAWSTITVITGGRNLEELRDRIDGLMLRRTQQAVGILPPIYETFPLIVSERARREADKVGAEVIAAIDAGDTKALEMHLGPLLRLTGGIVAKAVVEAIKEEFDCGLDKIVLAYWHKDVGRELAEGLSHVGVVGIDGSTKPTDREAAVFAFHNGEARVFLAQIQAAGEAIDLSAASELMFVEMSWVPKDGAQMALRVTNHSQTRQPRVRVAAIAGSVHEAIQSTLLRKVQTIQEVLPR